MAEQEEHTQIQLFGKTFYGTSTSVSFAIENQVATACVCGEQHSLILSKSGAVFCLGANDWGQLGLGHTKRVIEPTKLISVQEKIKGAAGGRSHTLLLTEKGAVLACGSNEDVQLCTKSDADDTTRPVPVVGLPKYPVTALCAGAEHSCVLTDKGQVYVWGTSTYGQLGLGKKYPTAKQPKQVKIKCKAKKALAISCGYYHTLVVMENGQVFGFGEGEGGKLGADAGDEEHTPIAIKGLQGSAVQAAGGAGHSLVLTDKALYAFGDNSSGQLGLPENVPVCTDPTPVPLPVNVDPSVIATLAAGEAHSAFTTTDGRLYAAGSTRHSAVGVAPSGGASAVYGFTRVDVGEGFAVQSVACGACHTAAIALWTPTTAPSVAIDGDANDTDDGGGDDDDDDGDDSGEETDNSSDGDTDRSEAAAHGPLEHDDGGGDSEDDTTTDTEGGEHTEAEESSAAGDNTGAGVALSWHQQHTEQEGEEEEQQQQQQQHTEQEGEEKEEEEQQQQQQREKGIDKGKNVAEEEKVRGKEHAHVDEKRGKITAKDPALEAAPPLRLQPPASSLPPLNQQSRSLPASPLAPIHSPPTAQAGGKLPPLTPRRTAAEFEEVVHRAAYSEARAERRKLRSLQAVEGRPLPMLDLSSPLDRPVLGQGEGADLNKHAKGAGEAETGKHDSSGGNDDDNGVDDGDDDKLSVDDEDSEEEAEKETGQPQGQGAGDKGEVSGSKAITTVLSAQPKDQDQQQQQQRPEKAGQQVRQHEEQHERQSLPALQAGRAQQRSGQEPPEEIDAPQADVAGKRAGLLCTSRQSRRVQARAQQKSNKTSSACVLS